MVVLRGRRHGGDLHLQLGVTMRRALWAAASLLSLAACGGCDSPPSQAVTACEGVSLVAEKTDILFVVDDSGSMQEEQANLAANFQVFIEQLTALPVKNAYQIGITTTSVENFGATPTDVFLAGGVPGSSPARPCPQGGKTYPKGALVAVDPASIATYPTDGVYVTNLPRVLSPASMSTPELVAAFQTNVLVGICGSGKEEGLAAARLALTDRVADGQNAGFLRSGARLVVIIVSDEDDCTETNVPRQATDNDLCHDPTVKANVLEPVQDFVDFLGTTPIEGEQREALVAVIAGVDPATKAPDLTNCATAFDKADRYRAFVTGFGAKGLIDSICNASFASTLEQIATLIGQEVPLSEAPADWRLLTVSVVKPDGSRVPCTLTEAGSDGGAADVVYAPPTATRPPTLTFGGACGLQAGDQVDVKMVCAG